MGEPRAEADANAGAVHSNGADQNPEQEELEALGRIAHAFREYRADAEWETRRWEYNYSRLSPAHQELLNHIPAKAAAARQCIYQNHLFLKSMFDWMESGAAPEPLCLANAAAEAWSAAHGDAVNPADTEKVRYVIKNAVRDWSEAGAAERAESYGAILSELLPLLEPQVSAFKAGTGPPPRVLVPGCGLGRLPAELAAAGCEALGNEHSYYMLLASAFILNAPAREEQFTVFPWVHSPLNHVTTADQLRPVSLPDVVPSELVQRTSPGLLGMAAGEFVEVFNSEEYDGYFDSVVTCFFIDTAHNVIEYLETIWRALRPGGWWVNLGPLQWHWADAHTYIQGDEMSIECSLAEVAEAARRLGFDFLKKENARRCRYMCNDASMLHQAYQCALWVAQKPLESENGGGGGDGH